MASKPGNLATGVKLTNWQTINASMGANEIPISVSINNLALINQNNEQVTFRLYLVVDNSWTNYATLGDTTITARGSSTIRNTTWTVPTGDRNKFKGKALYFRGWVTSDGSGTTRTNNVTTGTGSSTTITINYYAGVTAGQPIKKTDLTNNGITPDDATLVKYRTKFSAGTSAAASTFNSQVLGIS